MERSSKAAAKRSRRLFMLLMLAPILICGGLFSAVGLGIVEAERLQSTWERLVGLVPTTIFSLPAAKPGSPMDIDLTEEPSAYYGTVSPTPADRQHAKAIDGLGVIYDPGLGQAARELAAFYATYRRLAPASALHFILDAAGTSYWGVRQAVAVTSDDSTVALRNLVESQLSNEAMSWHCGVGEIVILDQGPARVLVVLTAQRTVSLEPIPRSIDVGSPLNLDGYLSSGYEKPRLLMMGPNGEVVSEALQVRGERFEGSPKLDEGTWSLELLATGPAGPTPIAQLTIFVGMPIPDGYESTWPPDESEIVGPSNYALKLLNRDRMDHGLPELEEDPKLSEIAQAHSRDMRRAGFVGHRSPTTGMVTDRLLAARFWSVAHGENVALNSSISDAQAGLMQSLGHRKNMLSRQYTHAGLGAVPSNNGWYVTQIFSRPAKRDLDARQAAYDLYESFNNQREPALAEQTPLDEILTTTANLESRSGRVSLLRAIEKANASGYKGAIAGWSTRLAELKQFDVPDEFKTAQLQSVGFGVHHFPDEPPPNIQVVVLMGR